MKKMKKKSQFEIFGVVLIVIILVLAMFFLIGSSLRKKKDITQSFTDAELGQNMLTSLVRMKVDDCGTDVSEIIKWCVSDIHGRCSQNTKDNSCGYLHNLFEDVFSKTLDKWNKKYYFKIIVKKDATDKGSDIMTTYKTDISDYSQEPLTSGNCHEFSDKEAPGIIPLPSIKKRDSEIWGPIMVKLEICK